MTHVVAFDPALVTIAILDSRGNIERLAELPTMQDSSSTWIHGGQLQSLLIDALTGRPARCVLQRQGAIPWRVAAAYDLGMRFGSVLAVCQARHLRVELVANSWKRSLGLSADTAAAVPRARMLFPSADLGIAHQQPRATALLLASWAAGRGTPT